MATAPTRTPAGGPPSDAGPYVPPIPPEELARRNRAAVELLASFEADGDEQDQRETMQALRAALGSDRVASSRPQFP